MKIAYIHGLNSSSKIFNHIHSQLPEHDSLFLDYNTSHSIEESYSFIISKLNEDEPLSIVSHSLGGLIAYLIATRDNKIKIDKLVTLSSPFGGSDHARFLKWIYPGYKILNDLSPRSNIINEINQSQLKKTKMISLISTHGSIPLISEENDGVVTIKSQQASLAKKKIDIQANHFEIVQDIKTIHEIKKFIFSSRK